MTVGLAYRAALFDGPHFPLRLEGLTLPALLPGEVLVRVACCTLCGSDFHTFHGRRTSPLPAILGHEVVGIVEELSPDDGSIVDYLGQPIQCRDRITWSIAISCGQCRICRAGLPQKCEALFKYGHELFSAGSAPSGGLSQYCVLRRGTVILPVPHTLPDVVAATANCAAATVMAAVRATGPLGGATVLIQGAGMLGLTAAAVARESGATVIVADPDTIRLRNATAFGATHAVTSTCDLLDLTNGTGIDVAFEFSGDPSAVETAMPLLAIGARYILGGAVFPARPAAIDMETVVRKMIRISGVHNYAPPDLQSAVDFLSQQRMRYPFQAMIPRRFELEDVNDALVWAGSVRPPRVAIVPKFNGVA